MDKTITLDGKEFPIRPTPLAKMARMMPVIEKDELFTEEGALALSEAVFHGIRRAKGEVTQEFVAENIDMTNMDEVFAVFFEVNGLKKRTKGVTTGEAGAGAAS